MRQSIYIILFIIFSFSRIDGYTNISGSWERITTGFASNLIYIGGSSLNDFWVQTSSGLLIEIRNKKPIIHFPPSKIKYIRINYFQLKKNIFLCVVTNRHWQSKIYKIIDGKWKEYSIISDVPLKIFFKSRSGAIFLSGDSGSILKLEGNQWRYLQTPFHSHIVTIKSFHNNFLISTRFSGLFLFDGSTFRKIPSSDEISFVTNFAEINNKIFCLTNNKEVYSFNGNNLTREPTEKYLSYFSPQKVPNKFGFEQSAITVNNKIIRIRFPQTFNVNKVAVVNKNAIILLSKDGNIYINNGNKQNIFTELAQVYRMADLPNSENKGVEFFDANNDGIADLLTINRDNGNYLNFYMGVKNSPFANITSITNLPFNNFEIDFFTIIDFNKDGLLDIVLQAQPDSTKKLLFFRNNGNFQFSKYSSIPLPSKLQDMGIRDLTIFDYDIDGDNDLIVTTYYGSRDENGYVLFYKNNLWGNFTEIDSSLKNITRKWNEKILFGDYNNDGRFDIYLPNSWSNNILLLGNDSGYVNASEKNFSNTTKDETKNAFYFDIENDGDLDLITSTKTKIINIYKNDGNAFFTESSENLLPQDFLKKNKTSFTTSINYGDFNNDTFTDIFLSTINNGSVYSYILFNHNGIKFTPVLINFAPNKVPINKSSISDFDNDGDLDIYGGTNKNNILLSNNLDKNNFIEISLHGIISPTIPLGTKVWVFQAGDENSKKSLIGYKELSDKSSGTNTKNDTRLHFGLGKFHRCDLIITFPSGNVIKKSNVKAGSFLTVYELNGISAFFYKLPGNVYRFAQNRNNQIYLIIIFLSFLIIYYATKYGIKRYNWKINLILILTFSDFIFFVITLYITSFSNNLYIKFLPSFGVAFIMSFAPLFFYRLSQSKNEENISVYNAKLLELVLSFSHGKWALRNLNTLILLCNNAPTNWTKDEEFVEKLNSRISVFKSMTNSAIKDIINYSKLSLEKNINIAEFDYAFERTLDLLEKDKKIQNLNLHELAISFSKIRNGIKLIRDYVISKFSSSPTEVINNVIKESEMIFKQNNITVEKEKYYNGEIPVLIRSHELANILDNLIQNSLRFFNSDNKIIKLTLLKESPLVVIRYSNNGTKIPKDIWEKIFEKSYSESKSSGRGLFEARETLKKYDGKIFVEASSEEETVFRIELNEGIIINEAK